MRIVKLLLISFLLSQIPMAQKGDIAQMDFAASVRVVKEMTQGEVANISQNGCSLWLEGVKVFIVMPSHSSTLAEKVYLNLCQGSVSSMQKFWLALVFQGRTNPPVFLQTPVDIVNYIRNNRGAIGVVSQGSVSIPGGLSLIIN